MPKLFEAFIHARLRRHLAGVLDVVAQQQHRFAANRSDPRIQPDLEFRIGKETRYVADAKYKLTTDGLGRISDYYQLLAYATVLQVPEGVLIYCHDDGDPPPSRLIVQNTSIVLWVRAVALNGTPSDVDARLRNLAVWIAGRQSRPAR